MFKTSLGVTKDRILGETNDCAVIALANTTGLPYADIHSRLKAKGRRSRKGTKIILIDQVLSDLKAEGIVSEYKSVFTNSHMRPTVQHFMYRLPKEGRFFLCCTTHAFALTDGVVYDNVQGSKTRARMRVAIQVKMTSKQVPAASLMPPPNVWTPVVAPAETRPRFDAEEYQRRAVAAKLAQL